MHFVRPRYKYLRIILVSGIALLAIGGVYIFNNQSNSQGVPLPVEKVAASPTDSFIHDRHWQMAGVEHDVTKNILKVTHKGLGIVQQDGSAGQANSPLNLYGVRADVSGDFTVTAAVSNLKGRAALSLYGQPPLIEDELRAELATLDMEVDGNNFRVNVYDVSRTAPLESRTFHIRAQNEHQFRLERSRDVITLVMDGNQMGSVAEHGIFKTGQLWFGFDARSIDGSFMVNDLRAQGVNGGSVVAVDTRKHLPEQTESGLGQLLQKKRNGLHLGAAVALGPLVADGEYRQLLGNFTAVSIENALKFQFVHPLSGNQSQSYTFAEADGLVSAALQSGMKIHGHALVFGEANPQWVQKLAEDHPDQLAKVMTDHVETLVSRYKGRVASWDVINEPLADYDTDPGEYGLRQHIWYQAIGPDYIAQALRAAHEADPKAELWINEFGLETDDDRFTTMLDLVRKLKTEGVPLTGIGFQAHLDETDAPRGVVNIEQLRGRIRALEKLGFKSRISELDITSESQFRAYREVVALCLQEKSCVGVTSWGITDKYSSSAGIEEGSLVRGMGLLWDESLRPTTAVNDLRNLLNM